MRTVVKHSYIQARSANAKAKAIAHLNYIQHRSGHDKEQGGRLFFDKDRDESSGAEFRHEIKNASRYGTVMHKLILSPGVQGTNLKEYTREVMEELGEARGQDLIWQAVAHTNTEHDHVHVTVLGHDYRGGRVKFTRHDHEHARAVGDRYIERKHEFDRYYDRTLDRILGTEQPPREFDLDKLTDTYYRPEKEYEKKKGGRGSRGRKGDKSKESETHERYRTNLPFRRKGRKQRLIESRGRKDSDYFHDLYVSNTNRQRLEQLKEARPELRDSIEQQLAAQDKHDAERRAQNAKQVAELERILGIGSFESKKHESALKATEKPQEKEQKKAEFEIGSESSGSKVEPEHEQMLFDEKKVPAKDKMDESERKKGEKPREAEKEKQDEKERLLKDQEILERARKEAADIQVGYHLHQEMERQRIESERRAREKEEEERRLREEEERRRREEEERRQAMQSGDDEEY